MEVLFSLLGMAIPVTEITVPVNYVVMDTAYTSRLVPKCHELESLIKPQGSFFTPIFVQDSLWGDGLYVLNDESHSTNEVRDIQLILHQVLNPANEGNGDGIVAFRTSSLSEVFKIYEVLQVMDYCSIISIENIRLFKATVNGKEVTIAYVQVESESG